MPRCRCLRDSTTPRLLQLHGRGQSQQWEPTAAQGLPHYARGNLGAETSSWHRAAMRMKKASHLGPRKCKNMGRFEREHPHCGVSGLLPICLAEKSDRVTNSLLKTTETQIFEKVPSLKRPWECFLEQQQQEWQQHSSSVLVSGTAQPAAFQPGNNGSREDWQER